MGKTRRKNQKLRSRRHKRGGKRNQQNYIPTLTTQITGGGVQAGGSPAPAPAPAGPAVNINLDYPSVKTSLDTFGNAVYNLKSAMTTGNAAADLATAAATAQKTAMTSLVTAADSLWNAFAGMGVTRGLYRTILNRGEVYMPPPAAPAPAPRA